jgi:hypothetical protein
MRHVNPSTAFNNAASYQGQAPVLLPQEKTEGINIRNRGYPVYLSEE